MLNKPYPYPEIVTGEVWTVNETIGDQTPCTDNLNRQMYVPMDRECDICGLNHGRMIRRHELGHVKWSPKTMGKLPNGTRPEAIEVLEEIRVNYLMFLNGLGINEPTQCIDIIEAKTFNLINKASVTDLILYGLACFWHTNNPHPDAPSHINFESMTKPWERANRINSFCLSHEYTRFKAIMADAIVDSKYHKIRQNELQFVLNTVHTFADRLIRSRGSTQTKISYKKVQKLAQELSVILNTFLDKPKADEILAPTAQPNAGGQSGEGDGEEGDEAGAGDAHDLEKRMRQKLSEKLIDYHTSQGTGIWGDMEIHNPPLTVNLQSRLKGARNYRASDFGYNPKYINRYCIDKKIFKQKQTVLGGTILIDASGSMRFDGEDILEIMTLLPAVTIAMYNGRSHDGDLRIIAKGGMRVDQKYLDRHSGGGNVVDGPALEWLATMPARRIWVSDMHVFGRAGSDSSGANLIRECLNIVTKHKIINLQDINEVKEHAIKLNMV